MPRQLAEWVLLHRWKAILLTIAIVAVAASGARHLKFTADYRAFFEPDNPQLQAYETLQNTYTKNANVLLVLAPKDGHVFSRETLAAVERLTEAAWQIPFSYRVDSVTNFQHTRAEGDDLSVNDLVSNAKDLSDAQMMRVERVALSEPLLVSRLVSLRGHVTAVNIALQIDDANAAEQLPVVVDYVRQLAQRVRAENPAMDVYLTGSVMQDNAFGEASQQDAQTLLPVMFLLIVVTLGLMLRTVTGTLATVLVIVFSVVSALGMAGWLGMKLTTPSAAAPNIILPLAVANCVHVLAAFINGMRNGLEKRRAMVESLRVNLQPVFLTCLTTVLGFLSLNFSDAPPFHDMGNITAMGVVASFLLAMVFLPALMMMLPVRVAAVTPRHGAMDAVADFVVRRRNFLLWGTTAFMLALVAFIPANELDDNFAKDFDETMAIRQASDFATQNLTGLTFIEYSLNAGEAGGINDPAYLNHVEAFARWYRQQPETIHVSAVTDVVKRLNKTMHNDNPAWYSLPAQRQLAAQYLLLYEMSLPYGLDLNNQINIDKSATRFTVLLKTLSTNQLLALEQRAQQWMKDNLPPQMQTLGASPAIMYAHISYSNIRSMLTGTTVALLLISLTLVVALRSVKVGLISMIPNLIPIGMTFGLWGLLVGKVGLAASAISAIALGIVVDDTVHFLSKYLRARREQGLDAQGAVRYAFSTVGTALWTTSVVLTAGFLVLSFSHFAVNSEIGTLTATAIVLALAADFLFLPALLMKLEEKAYEENAAVAIVESGTP